MPLNAEHDVTVWLTADEASARLAISKPTLYAYVSRGRLARSFDDSGRRSRFNAREVADLRASVMRPRRPDGIDLRLESAVTRLDESSLYYRGITIAEVCATRNFEATAELLWDEGSDARMHVEWKVNRAVREAAANAWASTTGSMVPGSSVTRIASVVLTIAEAMDRVMPNAGSPSKHDAIADARTIISALTASMPGVRRNDRTVAQRLWRHLARREPARGELELLDLALVCLADHEIATSTFAVRVAASTRARPAAAIVTGLGVGSGPAHGSASGPVFALLQAAQDSGRPVRAIKEALAQKKYLPGTGHKVYKTADPRHELLMAALRRADVNRSRRAIVDAVLGETQALIKVPHNVDFALGAIAFCCELPAVSGELIFSVARIAGWIAHYIEELGEPILRYRVRASYRGK